MEKLTNTEINQEIARRKAGSYTGSLPSGCLKMKKCRLYITPTTMQAFICLSATILGGLSHHPVVLPSLGKDH
jgi:hypothetical protein